MLRLAYYLIPSWMVFIMQGLLARLLSPFMVYGYYSCADRAFRKGTRVSSSAKIVHAGSLKIGDHCWIGHHCFIDASGGLTLGEGVQISALVSVVSHSSHIAIRLLGARYMAVEASARPGYVLQPVSVGDYSFIGVGAVLLPGTTLGRGCVVGAGSVVKGQYEDYTVLAGNPARVIGIIDDMDRPHLADPAVAATYFSRDKAQQLLHELNHREN